MFSPTQQVSIINGITKNEGWLLAFAKSNVKEFDLKLNILLDGKTENVEKVKKEYNISCHNYNNATCFGSKNYQNRIKNS